MTAPADINSDKPASPAAIAMAQQAVRDFHECFWFRHPDADISTIADVRLVVERLRKGNRAALQRGQLLHQCL